MPKLKDKNGVHKNWQCQPEGAPILGLPIFACGPSKWWLVRALPKLKSLRIRMVYIRIGNANLRARRLWDSADCTMMMAFGSIPVGTKSPRGARVG